MTKQQYIDAYYQDAINACADSGIFPVLALAESAVESGWGGTQLAIKANNLFGVKAFPGWTGKTISMPTKEYNSAGQPYMTEATFRAYDSAQDSFTDYIKVVEESRYTAKGDTTAATPQEQIQDIAAGGYSTSPTYAQLITEIINELQPLLPQ